MSRVNWKVVIPRLVRAYGSVENIPRREIAKRYGVTVSAVSQAIKRWREKYEKTYLERELERKTKVRDCAKLRSMVQDLLVENALLVEALGECMERNKKLSHAVTELKRALEKCREKRREDWVTFAELEAYR